MRCKIQAVIRRLDGKPSRGVNPGVRGQSLVELTVTLPILVLMILGMVEIGFMANNYLTLMDVVRETARRGVVLDVTEWPDGDARNQQRLDCDRNSGTYNLFANQAVGAPGYRTTPRGPDNQGYSTSGTDPEYGYFDQLACHALAIMDPIRFDDNGLDDIVISVVSYSMMDYNKLKGTGRLNPAFESTLSDPKKGYRVTVTGRFPLENRYCTDGTNGDDRDPFDFMRPEYLNGAKAGADPDAGEMNNPEISAYRRLAGTSQGVRGYVFWGKANAEGGCIGSRFTVQDVEKLLNLPGDISQVSDKTPNGGLIIVELHWQHHPMFLGPLFRNFDRNDRSKDPIFYIYTIFPASSATPTATPENP